MGYRIVEPNGSPQIAVQHSAPVESVLRVERQIETVCVAQRGNVSRTRALAQHLLNRIARHNVDKQEDDGHHQPQHGQRVPKARQQRSQQPFHPVAFSATGSSCSILTLLMRLPLISSTVSRRPSYSIDSPP